MSAKPNFTSAQLRAMSDEELAAHWAGWAEHTGDWFLCQMEVMRRQKRGDEVRGWLAVAVSFAALLASLAALMK